MTEVLQGPPEVYEGQGKGRVRCISTPLENEVNLIRGRCGAVRCSGYFVSYRGNPRPRVRGGGVVQEAEDACWGETYVEQME